MKSTGIVRKVDDLGHSDPIELRRTLGIEEKTEDAFACRLILS
jgi:bifunctional DNA-binding transcriptional regulator/antitoxin component of YhaV-PrlF toxin-antitoxin module